MKPKHYLIIGAIAALALAASCSSQRKLAAIKRGNPAASLVLGKDMYVPEIKEAKVLRDTLRIKDDDGTELLLMKAIKDEETGDMVATETLDAAKITARFRNIAERHGKVDLSFAIIVPGAMQDSKWQLRFYPDMYMLGDVERLEPVIITGNAYRKAQLRGYQQYNRFLSRIISDTTRFVNVKALEIFLRRNIPQLYAFKTDSSYVSDEHFYTIYGVSEQQAVEHYTNKIARNLNNRRKDRLDEMYRKYVKVPIVTEGIRLDTVMVGENGDFIYNYVQTIATRPRLRKVDIVLSGDIYESDRKLYAIPESSPLTFYISSVSGLADQTEHYMTKIIERHADASTTSRIDFQVGKSNIDLDLGENRRELGRIRRTLSALLENDTFLLDSIIVTASASPEGSENLNWKLSRSRSVSIAKYLDEQIKVLWDSLDRRNGLRFDEAGRRIKATPIRIPFVSRYKGENWDRLDFLVDEDDYLTEGDKSRYELLRRVPDLDGREALLGRERFYSYLRERLYPRLRTVAFDFHLHRKDMVKDTIHTTVLDSTYMRGVRALTNMDYDGALALLQPYDDYNTAIAYMGLDRNQSAMAILSRLKPTARVNYLLAILYARLGDEQEAVRHYLTSCRQEPAYVHRGNLDPEISHLIKAYRLNGDDAADVPPDL
jgi:tetratricopeptide (TPR) repeat protein